MFVNFIVYITLTLGILLAGNLIKLIKNKLSINYNLSYNTNNKKNFIKQCIVFIICLLIFAVGFSYSLSFAYWFNMSNEIALVFAMIEIILIESILFYIVDIQLFINSKKYKI